MLYMQTIQVKLVKGEKIVLCKRCGRTLTNFQSIERGYGPICWQKVYSKLRFVEIPDPRPTNPTQQKYRNPQLIKKLAAVHRSLEEFLFMKVHTKEEAQIKPILTQIQAQELPIEDGGIA